MLYDSGKYKAIPVHRLRYGEIEEIAKRYFEDKFGRADSFLLDVPSALKRCDYKQASFYLHQAAENYIRAVPMVYALYGYKEHDLAFLIDKKRGRIIRRFARLFRGIARGETVIPIVAGYAYRLVKPGFHRNERGCRCPFGSCGASAKYCRGDSVKSLCRIRGA